MFGGKPIIGLIGGIGAGKSSVAKIFAAEGCCVVSADDLVHRAYKEDRVKDTLRNWWGNLIFDSAGNLDRSVVARKIFTNEVERRRLEAFIHPIVNGAREILMREAALNSATQAFIWDTPLLVETGVNRKCDAVIFVDTPREIRLARLAESRGWSADELDRREKSQAALETKRAVSHYVISNDGNEARTRDQAILILTRILEKSPTS